MCHESKEVRQASPPLSLSVIPAGYFFLSLSLNDLKHHLRRITIGINTALHKLLLLLVLTYASRIISFSSACGMLLRCCLRFPVSPYKSDISCNNPNRQKYFAFNRLGGTIFSLYLSDILASILCIFSQFSLVLFKSGMQSNSPYGTLLL